MANINSGVDLANALNKLGTCRYNMKMRHRVWWNSLPAESREGVIAYFAKEPMYYNHSELLTINQWAVEAGVDKIPFPIARPLPEDNGECFFGDCMVQHKERTTKCSVNPQTK